MRRIEHGTELDTADRKVKRASSHLFSRCTGLRRLSQSDPYPVSYAVRMAG